MLSRSLSLFRPFGIDVRVHWTWLILAVLVTSSLATGWFPQIVPNATTSEAWLFGAVGAIGLFASILIHELCHALVGRAYKMPMETITLFLFGGVAHMEDEPPSPKAEFWMALAGPAASVVLAVGFYFAYAYAVSSQTLGMMWVALFSYFASINIVVAVFNMLPGYPLDGGRVLRSILWYFKKDIVAATRIAAMFGQGLGFLLLALGLAAVFSGVPGSGIWAFVLGLLLIGFARASYTQLVIKRSLHGHAAAEFMNEAPLTVTPQTPLSELMRNFINREEQLVYPVVEAQSGEFVGCVNPKAVNKIPEKEWDQHVVREILEPCTEDHQIEPEADAESAFTQMAKSGYRELIVVKGQKILGILSQASLIKYVSLKEA